jgi:hypothetical protein
MGGGELAFFLKTNVIFAKFSSVLSQKSHFLSKFSAKML